MSQHKKLKMKRKQIGKIYENKNNADKPIYTTV